MEKEELLTKRIQELASLAERRGCITFTDFLNLNEQNILQKTIQKFSWIRGETFGGYEGAERCITAFLPEQSLWNSSENDEACMVSPSGIVYPIHCIHIRPRAMKFAEELSHRDVLGALMNLGIERAKTGDIAVSEKEAYLFCVSSLSELICHELTQIRRTQVSCELCNMEQFSYTPATQAIRGSIASVRLDSIMALGFGASRSSLLSLIEGGCVFVNGKLITTNAYSLKEGDIVSVRGMGRIRYIGTSGQTRKGRIYAEVQKYIS
ncbi:MAG: YlmH/Sll1252 family protein [Lachnospiraceae bacterium]|nr:YlmH/Sll1252 family protein [Lachnospiraceae bacterium]